MNLVELNHIGEVGALSEDRRRAIVDLLQERHELKARIAELKLLIEM